MSSEKEYLLERLFEDKETFKSIYQAYMEMKFGKSIEGASANEKYIVLCELIMSYAMPKWKKTREQVTKGNNKMLYYFSLEFLMGRMLTNNLMSLGLYNIVKDSLAELNIDINELEDCEADAGLGNGGLGRLAACFLDSLSNMDYSGNGNTIRYKNGLFKQLIIDNKQVEVPDQWLRYGYPWEIRKPSKAVVVKFYGNINISRDNNGDLQFDHCNYEEVMAVPYDMPVVGADSNTTNTLRMWSAEPSDNIPSNMSYPEYLMEVEDICMNLYPEDYSEKGKMTRIKQEYFFVSAGLQTVIKNHLKSNSNLDNLAEKVVIQLNDTHPALAIPELMRLLMDEHGYPWDKAYKIVNKVFAYTNHTVLQEALEKWPVEYIRRLLPRVYLIIEEIDNQFVYSLTQNGKSQEFIDSIRIISNGFVRMANLSIVGSFSVNGVAKIHSQIIIDGIFKNFYEIFPWKFSNKTNGVTHRRWLMYANSELTQIIERNAGIDLKKNFFDIEKLINVVDSKELQEEFMLNKQEKKKEFADYVKKIYNIDIDPNSIFDCQTKRLHAYKRQLLNILHIISLYHKIKRDPNFTMPKTTYIFGAKAASNYYFAKDVIRLINCVGETIKNDPQVSKFINVVFIPNYRVTIAEKLIPAADVSEQISTAGKEASGTSNMKYMMNGAITLGTMDGANIEIKELVGDDNIVIFGLSESEVNNLRTDYHPYEYYLNNPVIKEVVDSLTDGTFCDDKNAFLDIYYEFVLRNDEYFILADFDSYVKAHEKINELYQDRNEWTKKCLINIAKSGPFSSDRTIRDYVEGIWHLDKIHRTDC